MIPNTNKTAKTANQVKALLRASAAWEPDAPMPFDFAEFAHAALITRPKTKRVYVARFAPIGRVVFASACLAGACFLGGGRVSRAPAAPFEAGRVVFSQSPAPFAAAPRPVRASLAALPVEAAPAAAGPAPLRTDAASKPSERLRRAHRPRRTAPQIAQAAQSIRNRTASFVPSAQTAPGETTVVAAAPAVASGAAVWTTETVERPAWGALVPVTVACSVPSAEPGGEPTDALMPVVLDVALSEKPDEIRPAASAVDAAEDTSF